MGQADAEQAIRDEERVLDVVSHLIDSRRPFSIWPKEFRQVLLLALSEEGLMSAEAAKVTTLRRHLFGPTVRPEGLGAYPSFEVGPRLLHSVERLRADLPARVCYRSGLALFNQ